MKVFGDVECKVLMIMPSDIIELKPLTIDAIFSGGVTRNHGLAGPLGLYGGRLALDRGPCWRADRTCG